MSSELFPDFNSTNSLIEYFSSIGIQAIIFIIAMITLNRFIFLPVIKILKLRKKNVEDLEVKQRELLKKNAILSQEYDWRMDGAFQLAREKREMAYLIGSRRAEMILVEAKRESGRDIRMS